MCLPSALRFTPAGSRYPAPHQRHASSVAAAATCPHRREATPQHPYAVMGDTRDRTCADLQPWQSR